MQRDGCSLLLALRVNALTCNSLPDWDKRGGKTLNHTQGAQPDPSPLATTRGCARDWHSGHTMCPTCSTHLIPLWQRDAGAHGQSLLGLAASRGASRPFADAAVTAPFPASASAGMLRLQTRGAALRNSAKQNLHRSEAWASQSIIPSTARGSGTHTASSYCWKRVSFRLS